MNKFSVLLSVYKKENPQFLKKSLDSIFSQTRKADEVVLVEDGPLTPELDDVIEKFVRNEPTFKLVVLKNNQGLGRALNAGMKECTYKYVARMDTDDICYPNRFEKQMDYIDRHPEVELLGTWTQEFTEDENGNVKLMSLKKFPKTNDEIYKFGKKRNPFEHPSVIFKKESVIKAGEYVHCYLFEDYYLWARMMLNKAVMYNIPEPLLYFRMTMNSFERRGGWNYAVKEVYNLWMFKQVGFFTFSEFLTNVVRRFPIRIMPNKMRKWFYNKVLRKY